jgi:hypothetical protein
MKPTIIVFASVAILAVFCLALLATSVPAVSGNYSSGKDVNCICDHPYYTNPYGNEYYFWHDGGPTYPTYDVWTGCDVTGHYGTPNPYYNYDWANYDFESGTGGYYSSLD